jgi:hypothetical protein
VREVKGAEMLKIFSGAARSRAFDFHFDCYSIP